jgi:PAS domain S-box-containing protein
MLSFRHFPTTGARRYIAGSLGAAALSYIDWFVPQTVSDSGLEVVRRSRLLVAASFILILFELPFLTLMYHFEGYMSPTAWSFVSGALFLIFNPFLLRWTGSHVLPGVLLSLEVIVHFAAMSYYNGGYDSAVLVWHPIVPLLATLLIGPRLGLACAVFVAIETIALYLLDTVGYPFPQPLTAEQIRVFHVAGSATVIVFVGVIAWLYEQLRKSAIDLAEKATSSLRQSERYFRALIENASDLITIVDSHGVIQYCNPAYERGLGYHPTELLRKSAVDLVHPDDRHRVLQAFSKSRLDSTALLECRVLHKDGDWRIFEAGADNLLHDPAVQGVIITSRDITERKQIERLKDELVSTVSHELRTPLTSLRGFTELMLKKDFSRDKQREFLTIIQNESIRLTNLINDFLDLQRMESGRQTYNFSPIHIDMLMREVAAIIAPDNGRHPLHTAFPGQLPQVHADADRLRQVLSNLISNAVKYSPQGGRITVGARQQKGEVVAWVADEGMGIPPEAIPRLFTKFFRVDSRDTRSISGTGLGLSLVKRIIEAHEGRVWVESVEGVGSTFFFTLPILEQPNISQEQESVLL